MADAPDEAAAELERRWAAVMQQLKAAAAILTTRGSIASRLTGGGTRVYSVRFTDDTGRQRAIYLGPDGELVRRARDQLAAYRAEEQLIHEVEEAARFLVASSRQARRWLAGRRCRRT